MTDWENGRRKGKGVLTKNNKLFEFSSSDQRHRFWGRISQFVPEDNYFKLLYTGEIKNNVADGFGYQHKSDGSYYEGQFFMGLRDGYGRCWFNDGSFYEGYWKNNAHNGNGLLVYRDGNRYEGEWSKGQKNGSGRFYHLNSGKLQLGIWEDGIAVTSTLENLPSHTSVTIPPIELSPAVPSWVKLKKMEAKLFEAHL